MTKAKRLRCTYCGVYKYSMALLLESGYIDQYNIPDTVVKLGWLFNMRTCDYCLLAQLLFISDHAVLKDNSIISDIFNNRSSCGPYMREIYRTFSRVIHDTITKRESLT